MTVEILLLYASETGTTELVADEIVDACRDHARFRLTAKRMDVVTPQIFESGRIYLLLSSSTGKGELPKNGRGFHSALQALPGPLADIRYGIIGFGDQHYAATFGAGPNSLDREMQRLGAIRIGTLAQHDRQSGIFPEQFALDWLGPWLDLLAAHS